jgi:DNA-directed RNA polymerase specialized sigma24 family protein
MARYCMSETPETLIPDLPQPEPSLAEVAEIISALQTLSDGDLRILKSFGTFLMLGARGQFFAFDAQDLIQEAIARTLDRIRKWEPQKIDFVTHLKGCMRSIADEWQEKAGREPGYGLDAELSGLSKSKWIFKENEDYAAQQILDHARLRLNSDAMALRVLDHIVMGYRPAEIRELLNINANVYNAARKRITRSMLAMFTEWQRESKRPITTKEGPTHE